MSEQQRETITFQAGKHELVAYAYVTGYDLRNISNAAFEKLEVMANTNKVDVGEIRMTTGTMLAVKEDAKIKAVIVSVDGKTDNVLDEVLKMRGEDFDVVMKHINRVTERMEDLSDPKAPAGTEQNSQDTPAPDTSPAIS